MEPFKNFIDAALVRRTGQVLAHASSEFDRAVFERRAIRGLDALELKARVMQLADALEATLPADFDAACGLIEACLGTVRDPDSPDEDEDVPCADDPGLTGWIVWSLGEFVARRGLAEPERALRALHALTQRSTAEFAIRPLIVRHPELTLTTMQAWTRDPSAHVRRLASEGSRPRLPWGLRLQALVADPTPTLPILEALQDDPSAYVRRSVANHLNDIAKDHPHRVVDWVQRHLPTASAERRTLLSHASRGLIKQGHAGMLTLWGAGKVFAGDCELKVTPKRVTIGDRVQLTLALRSTSRNLQPLLIDYAVHHVKADGRASPKVFKGWKLTLAPGEARTLTKSHSFAPVTTRRYHAGEHPIEVSINGRVVARTSVRLSLQI